MNLWCWNSCSMASLIKLTPIFKPAFGWFSSISERKLNLKLFQRTFFCFCFLMTPHYSADDLSVFPGRERGRPSGCAKRRCQRRPPEPLGQMVKRYCESLPLKPHSNRKCLNRKKSENNCVIYKRNKSCKYSPFFLFLSNVFNANIFPA